VIIYFRVFDFVAHIMTKGALNIYVRGTVGLKCLHNCIFCICVLFSSFVTSLKSANLLFAKSIPIRVKNFVKVYTVILV